MVETMPSNLRFASILLLFLAVAVVGCGSASDDSAAVKAQDPDDLLVNVMDALKDDRPSVAGFHSAIQQLDTYLGQKKEVADQLVLGAEERSLLEKQLLSGLSRRARPGDPNTIENRMQEIERKSFTRLDAMHLDSCFLFRDAAQALRQFYVGEKPQRGDAKLAEYELNLAREAFAWVMRQVAFRPADSRLDPWPASEALRRGTGDGEERTRIFLALLEQLELPACVVTRTKEIIVEGKREPLALPWTPGVLIANEIYLFETRLGKPIPGLGGPGGVATLRQVRKDPAILKAFYQGDDDPVTSAQLESPSILIASSLPALSPRMRALQRWLVDSSNPAVVYQDLPGTLKLFRDAKPDGEVRLWYNRAGYPAVILPHHAENPLSEARMQEAIVPRTALFPAWAQQLVRDLGPQESRELFRNFDALFLNLRVHPTRVQEEEAAEQGALRMPGVENQPRREQQRTGGVRDLLVRGRPEQAVDRALDLEGKLDKIVGQFYTQIEAELGKTERDMETKWIPKLLKEKRALDSLVVERQRQAPGDKAAAAALERKINDAFRIYRSTLQDQSMQLVYLSVVWAQPEMLEHLTYFTALAKLELAIRAEHRAGQPRSSTAGVQLTPLQQWESAADWFDRHLAYALPRSRNHWTTSAQEHLQTCQQAIQKLKAAKP
jgi:hypothetical protein